MYLVISSEQSNRYLCDELARAKILSVSIPCTLLIPDGTAIVQLKQQINNFDIIIITSPTAIEYLNTIIPAIGKDKIFIVPGTSSYNRLRSYTANRIYAPQNGSGSVAIINQILYPMNLKGLKIAILHGKLANYQIHKYLEQKLGVGAYQSIIIYRQKWLGLNEQFMKKLFITNCLQGIILTSSSHAKYLFSQAQKFGYYEVLQHANFITLHSKIKQVLKELGVKTSVIVSDTASNQSLIDSIRKAHDRYSGYSKG